MIVSTEFDGKEGVSIESVAVEILVHLVALKEPLVAPLVEGSARGRHGAERGGRRCRGRVQRLDGFEAVEPAYVGRGPRIVGHALKLDEIALLERVGRLMGASLIG